MRIRVAVVEDDAFTLATLTAAIKSVDVDVVISVNNVAEAIQLSKIRMPNVALLDLHLGKGPSGIDLAHALRKQNPSIGIVFLTSFDDPRLLLGQAPVFPSRHFYVRKQDIGDLTSLVKILQLAYLGKVGGVDKSSGNPLANSQTLKSRFSGWLPSVSPMLRLQDRSSFRRNRFKWQSTGSLSRLG